MKYSACAIKSRNITVRYLSGTWGSNEKKVLTSDWNQTVVEKVPLGVEEDVGCAVLENMGTPGLPEFVGCNLVEAKDRGVACETAGCVWAIAAGYECDFKMKCPKTY